MKIRAALVALLMTIGFLSACDSDSKDTNPPLPGRPAETVTDGNVLCSNGDFITKCSVSEYKALLATGYEFFAAANGNWWDQNNGLGPIDEKWVYPDLPSICWSTYNAANGVGWQVLWAYPNNAVDQNTSKITNIRTAVKGAGSLFSASAHRNFASDAGQASKALSPRWITFDNCNIQVVSVPVPPTVYDKGNSATVDGGLRDYLVNAGYNRADRKYLVLLQRTPNYVFPSGIWQPHSENWTAQKADNTPSLDNWGNYNAFSFVSMQGLKTTNDKTDSISWSWTIAHEMTHALGAFAPAAPHKNSNNPGHPTDCWDILCYGNATGETFPGDCGAAFPNGYASNAAYRLDCHRDDYFTVNGDDGTVAKAWQNSWWNVAKSSYLYGNPAPTAAQVAAHPVPN